MSVKVNLKRGLSFQPKLDLPSEIVPWAGGGGASGKCWRILESSGNVLELQQGFHVGEMADPHCKHPSEGEPSRVSLEHCIREKRHAPLEPGQKAVLCSKLTAGGI